ncbi:MAG TPA: glycosyltransferase [Bacteroidia bacterium]|nr:glycosyltransferase [Bacteroidia bacterium]HRS59212.1 glycosyltransferase [Bacteroidia bacterium]HRU69233.1 glycosyltransferase [Bacteroidia bacterium]
MKLNTDNYAPICLFVYNRPEHTLKTLNSLKNARLAKDSRLFIFADGPKHGLSIEQILNIEKVRKIIRSEIWCRSVEIIESEKNKGLSKSIISGVEYVISRYGKVIVLEDDLILSAGFLEYMNEALLLYENEEKVMHIAGFIPRLKGDFGETFFYPVPTCWGWATWKRAWEHFNPSAAELLPKVLEKGKYRFDINRSVNYVRMLKKNMKGYVNSWFIRWYASIYLMDGLCLHPGKSLVANTGIDRSGVNSYRSDAFDTDLADSVKLEKIELKISQDAYRAFVRFNYKVKMKHLPEYLWRLATNRIKT